MILEDFLKKTTDKFKTGIKTIGDYFKPTEDVRMRDVIREIPGANVKLTEKAVGTLDPRKEVKIRPLGLLPEEEITVKGPQAATFPVKLMLDYPSQIVREVAKGWTDVALTVPELLSKGKETSQIKVRDEWQDLAKRFDLPMDEEGVIKSLSQRTLKRQEELDKQRPDRPKTNTLQAFGEEVVPTMFGIMFMGDIARYSTQAFLNTTKSAPVLGLSSQTIKNKKPKEIGEIVAKEWKSAVKDMRIDTRAGRQKAGKLVREVERMADGYKKQNIPTLNKFGQMLDDFAMELNKWRTIGKKTPQEGVWRKGAETLPGYRPVRPTARPAGLSIEEVEDVGRGVNYTTPQKTKERGLKLLEKSFGDKESAMSHAKNFWAKEGKENIFHHATKERSPFGLFEKEKATNMDIGLRRGISSINGLYVGRDAKALHEFYNLAAERGENIVTYKGNPKLLDLTDKNAEQEFVKKFKTGDQIEKELRRKGYDGVKYFDPYATGEEIVIINPNVLEAVAFNGKKIVKAKEPVAEAREAIKSIIKETPTVEVTGERTQAEMEEEELKEMVQQEYDEVKKEGSEELFRAIKEHGGLKVSEGMKEEMSDMPIDILRKDGFTPDEMAQELEGFRYMFETGDELIEAIRNIRSMPARKKRQPTLQETRMKELESIKKIPPTKTMKKGIEEIERLEKEILRKATIKQDKTTAQIIEGEKPPFIEQKKRETTLLKERLKTLARGAREGFRGGRELEKTTQKIRQAEKIGNLKRAEELKRLKQRIIDRGDFTRSGKRAGIRMTKAQIKGVQTELIDIVKKSEIDLNDQAKFIKTIKNVQTPEQLQKILPDIQTRISKLGEARDVREIKKQIAKELKEKFVITDKTGVRKGKATIEAQDKIKQIKEDLSMTQDKAREELIRLTQQEGETMEIADPGRIRFLMAGAGDANSTAWREVLEDIISIKTTGKTKFEIQKANELAKEQLQRDRWRQAIAPQGLLPGTGMGPVKEPGKGKSVIDRALKGLGSWEDSALTTQHLLDKLERGHVVPGELYLKGPITQFYTQGVTIAGNQRYEAVEKMHEDVNNRLSELWGAEKGTRKFRKSMVDHLQKENDLGTFIDWQGKEFQLKMTKDQMMYHWGQLQNPAVVPTYEAMNWDKKMIEALDNGLTTAEKEFVRWAGEGEDSFFGRSRRGEIDGIALDPIYEEIYKTRLGKVEGMYIPLSRDVEMPAHVQLLNDFALMNSTKISSIKSRTPNVEPIRLESGLLNSLEKHIQETTHWKTHAQFINKFRRLFSGEVREAVKQNFRDSGKLLKEIDRQMNHLAADGVKDVQTYEIIDRYMGYAYTGFIGASVPSSTKQLVSSIAWAGELDNPLRLFSDGADFWMSPFKKTRYLFKHSAGLRERSDQLSFEREAMRAVKSGDAEILTSRKNSFAKHVMVLTRVGDKVAILPGMWAKYLEELEKGTGLIVPRNITELESFIAKHPIEHEQAIINAQEAYDRTQQTGLIGKRSSLRRSGSWGNMWTFAMSAPEAQFNQSISTLRAMGAFGDPQRIPHGKGLLRLLIYLVMIPSALQAISDGFQFRKHRQLAAVGASVATLGVSNYPVFFGSLIQNASKKMSGLPAFDVGAPAPVSIMQDLADVPVSVGNMILEDMTMEEFFKEAKEISITLATGRGIPARSFERMITGATEYPEHQNIMRLFGWSEWSQKDQGIETKPDRDPFGNPIGMKEKLSMDRYLKGLDDPVIDEINRLDVELRYPSGTVAGQKLTPKEYDTYLKDYGPRLKSRLEKIMKTDTYKNYTDSDKIDWINEEIAYFRKKSREELFWDYYDMQDWEQYYIEEGMSADEAKEKAKEKVGYDPEEMEKKVENIHQEGKHWK